MNRADKIWINFLNSTDPEYIAESLAISRRHVVDLNCKSHVVAMDTSGDGMMVEL